MGPAVGPSRRWLKMKGARLASPREEERRWEKRRVRGGRKWYSFTVILRQWSRAGGGGDGGREIEMQQHSRMAARVFNGGLPKRAQWLDSALIIDDDLELEFTFVPSECT